jgi:2-methylcitrate dehydratase PrpD
MAVHSQTNQATNAAAGSYTQRLAAFAAAHRYQHLPPEATTVARETVLDMMGTMLLGAAPGYRGVWLAGDIAKHDGGPAECTVVGRDFKAPLLAAMLPNGIAGYSADAEGGWAAGLHTAAVLVPAALTVAEYTHASGQELIAALALGYDVMCRVSRAADAHRPYVHSFHPSAVYGHFGAAAIAGHLFGLDERQFVNALGLAGMNATGMIAWVDDPTEDSRGFVIGVAAQSGVRAARLAQLGMGGPRRILDDAKYSIYDAYSGAMNLDRLVEGLGETYWLARASGVKLHPCCGDITSGVDALLALRERHQLVPDQIARITHWVRPSRVQVIDNNPLKSHNSQYILAVAAARGEITPDTILVDQRADPLVAALYARAQLLPEPELDAMTSGGIPAIVEVEVKDGRRFREFVPCPKGFACNPFTTEELHAKFFAWATTHIGRDQAQRILNLTTRLEELPDVGELVALLAAPSTTPTATK